MRPRAPERKKQMDKRAGPSMCPPFPRSQLPPDKIWVFSIEVKRLPGNFGERRRSIWGHQHWAWARSVLKRSFMSRSLGRSCFPLYPADSLKVFRTESKAYQARARKDRRLKGGRQPDFL